MDYAAENMEIINWQQAREFVEPVNPELVTLIDEFSPDNSYQFIKIKYRFGQSILKNGRLHLPISLHETGMLSHPNIPKKIQQALGYCDLPMAMILNKKAEVFYESENRVMPTKIYGPGALIGLWEMFDPAPEVYVESVWNITAGVRSLFMLPKISNQLAHKQLQQNYKMAAYPPSHMLHHHQIFKEIGSNNHEDSWVLEVLYFGEKWQQLKQERSIEALKIHHYFLQEAWHQSYNCRNNMSFDMAWELFSKAVSDRNMKPKPLIVNTLKHLLAINDGFYPGYGPAIDESGAPIHFLKNAYLEIYKIKNEPTIMEPFHLSKANRPAYYSFQLPSLLENAPGAHGKNIIIDLRELKILMEMLQASFNEKKLNFRFFHPNEDLSYGIEDVSKIFATDPNFLAQSITGMSIAESSPFLKGCVQIALKQDRDLPLPLEVSV